VSCSNLRWCRSIAGYCLLQSEEFASLFLQPLLHCCLQVSSVIQDPLLELCAEPVFKTLCVENCLLLRLVHLLLGLLLHLLYMECCLLPCLMYLLLRLFCHMFGIHVGMHDSNVCLLNMSGDLCGKVRCLLNCGLAGIYVDKLLLHDELLQLRLRLGRQTVRVACRRKPGNRSGRRDMSWSAAL
jgi:hypothetical protein